MLNMPAKRKSFLLCLAETLFRRRALCCAVSLSLLTPISIHAVQAQGAPANLSARASQRKQLIDRLDSLTRDALSRIPVASVSVIVIHRQDTLIRRAYGQAELNFGVPATPATLYRLIGPGTTLLAAAVLRAAEQGRLALNEDASKYLPEFPWQGRRVTIRQLLDATSGLQDWHYLGDAYFRVARTPMRTDEVTALFAGHPFVHEPGAAWSWTISGFHLAGIILERVTGEPYQEYLQREVLTPAGLVGIVPCDGALVTPGLARGYNTARDGNFSTDVRPTVTAVRFLDGYCGTAAAVAAIPDALRRLLKPASYQSLITAQGPAAHTNPRDSMEGFGLGVRLGHEEGRRWWGEANDLLGYSSSWLHLPNDSLTVVLLTNTGGGGLPRRNLARAVLGLPLRPSPAAVPAVHAVPTTADERNRLLGLYRIELLNASSQHRAVAMTLCVYEEAGKLKGQYGAFTPFVLVKEADSRFARPDTRARFRFEPGSGRPKVADIEGGYYVTHERAIRISDTCTQVPP